MWLFFLSKFKRLFSTDDLINSTKEELNKIIRDLNRNVDTSITVSDNAASRLSELIVEAEKKIKLLADLEKQGIGLSELNKQLYSEKEAESAYKKNSRKRISTSYSVVPDKNTQTKPTQDESQKSLFDEENSLLNKETTVHVQSDGAAYASIPLISPKVYKNESPLKINRHDNLKKDIIKLYDLGNSIEDIATELSCSTTEVQFALTLEGRI